MDALHLDDLRIDSLVDLLKVSYSLEDHDRMIEIADKLYHSAQDIYNKQKKNLKLGNKYIYQDRIRHIIYYFGFSLLAKGIALQKKERYEESKQCIQIYSDLAWLNDGTEEANKEIEIFKLFAKANTFAVSLLEGRQEYLDPYVQFLGESRIEELLPGLMTILNSAIEHGYSVDSVLEHFEDAIRDAVEICSKKGEAIYLAKFYYRLSLYQFKMKQYKIAVRNTLKALAGSDTFGDIAEFKKCIVLFESFRSHADAEQQQQFTAIMNKILREELKNEKGISFDNDYIGIN